MPNSLDPTLYTDSGLTPTITAGGLTRDASIGLRGSANAGSRIEIYDGATLTSSSRPITTGLLSGTDWSAVTPALSDGIHVLTVKIIDANGTYTLFTSPQFTVDTVVSRAQIDHANESYTTNVQAISLQGWVELGATAFIYDGDTLLGTATMRHFYDGYDNFSYSIATLAPGAHELYALVTDQAGNTRRTPSIYPTIDLNPAHAAFDARITTDYGSISTNGVTRDNTVILTGIADAGSVVNVYNSASGSLLGTATMEGTHWSLTTPVLSDGHYSVNAVATSPLANVTRISGPQFDIDTTVNIYRLAGGGLDYATRNASFTASGFAESGATVTLYDGTTALGMASIVHQSGYDAFSFATPVLAEGTHQIFARVVDAVGNTADTSILRYTVDTVAPTVGITSRWSVNGWTLGTNFVQPESWPILALPRSRSVEIAGVVSSDASVQMFDGSTYLGLASKDASGTTWTYRATALEDGIHTLWARAVDAAGNASDAIASRSFVVDASVSAASITTALSPYTRANFSLTEGFSGHINLAGTAEFGAKVEIFDNGERVSSFYAVPPAPKPKTTPIVQYQVTEGYEQKIFSWKADLQDLGFGTHQLYAKVTDYFGNVAFTERVNTTVTPFMGDGGKDKFSGTNGDDLIVGRGGADTLVGGAGNDLIVSSDLAFAKVSGGAGTDTLRLEGSHLELDLRQLASKISGIEAFDISAGTGNSLILSLPAIVQEFGSTTPFTGSIARPPIVSITAGLDDTVFIDMDAATWRPFVEAGAPSYTSFEVHGATSANSGQTLIVKIASPTQIIFL